MYKLIISPKARRQLKNLPLRHKNAITVAIEEIKEDPLIAKPLTKELTGRYSYRVGIYRIIYVINKADNTIYILTAGHRASVYK